MPVNVNYDPVRATSPSHASSPARASKENVETLNEKDTLAHGTRPSHGANAPASTVPSALSSLFWASTTKVQNAVTGSAPIDNKYLKQLDLRAEGANGLVKMLATGDEGLRDTLQPAALAAVDEFYGLARKHLDELTARGFSVANVQSCTKTIDMVAVLNADDLKLLEVCLSHVLKINERPKSTPGFAELPQGKKNYNPHTQEASIRSALALALRDNKSDAIAAFVKHGFKAAWIWPAEKAGVDAEIAKKLDGHLKQIETALGDFLEIGSEPTLARASTEIDAYFATAKSYLKSLVTIGYDIGNQPAMAKAFDVENVWFTKEPKLVSVALGHVTDCQDILRKAKSVDATIENWFPYSNAQAISSALKRSTEMSEPAMLSVFIANGYHGDGWLKPALIESVVKRADVKMLHTIITQGAVTKLDAYKLIAQAGSTELFDSVTALTRVSADQVQDLIDAG